MPEIKGFEDAMLDNWKSQMASVVKAIELRVAHVLSEGRTPECVILSSQTINEIIDYSGGPGAADAIDWRNRPTLDVGEGGAVKLVIYRSADLPRGSIVIP